MTEILAVIDAPHFHAGLVLWDDVCVEAAPIIGYMKKGKWTRQRIRSFVGKKGWTISVVYQLERQKP